MITKIKKTGNSRAITIPPAILELLKIDDATDLELSTDGVSIKLTPIDAKQAAFEAANNQVLKKHLKAFKALADR